MKTSFYGDESFWGIGVVEDINDPLRAGRVKVRIYGLHSEDDGELPTSDLPWSQIAVDPTNAGISGLGKAPVGMVKGSLVHGKFMDGKSKQNFLVTGVIVGLTKRTKVQGELQGEPTLVGNSNPEIIFNYLRGKGFQEIEATGIVAAMAEHLGDDIDPSKFYLNGRFGIGLWDDNSLLAYREYALRKSAPVEDLETQLEFLVETLAARGWPNFLTKDGKSITPSTASEAATGFIQLYYALDTEKTKTSVKKKASEIEGAYGSSGTKTTLPLRVPPAEVEFGSHISSMEQLYALFVSCSRDVSELIVHHADTYENMDTDVYDVDSWHKNPPPGQTPFDQIGYHFIIRRDGRIQVGRDINIPGAHARGRNEHSVALSFIGGRKGHSNEKGLIRSSDTFTDGQWDSFDKFIDVFLNAYPNSNLLGHRDVDPERRTDPEFDVKDYVRSKKPQWTTSITPSPAQTIEEFETESEQPREPLNPVVDPPIILASQTSAPVPNADIFEDVTPVPIVITSTDTSSTVPSPFEDPITTIAGKQNPLSFDSLIPTTTIQLIAQTLFDQSILNYVQTSDLDNYLTINDVLDADTLDGLDSTAFALLTGANDFTTRPSVGGVNVALVSDLAGGFDQSADYVMSGDWGFTGLLEVNSNKVWHEGNDGAGSGLDADTLDGFQATDFIQAGAGSDADTLDGEHGAYYLDWDNFTDLPAAFPPTLHDHDAGNITSGVLDVARIPPLPYILSAEKNSMNGVAGLDPQGKIYSNQLPAIAITTPHTVANISARDNLTVQEGDVAIVLDDGAGYTRSYIYDDTNTWREMSSPGQVLSVAGKTGAVSLDKSDVNLGDVDNTSDANKPISTATQTALDDKVSTTGNESISGIKTFTDVVQIVETDRARLNVSGGGPGFSAADVLLENTGSSVRAAGTFMFDNTAGNEWFMGRPYAGDGTDFAITYGFPTTNNQGKTTANANNALFTIKSNGDLFAGTSNAIWHEGNDGSGSGLDADLLDGLEGSSFLRSDTAGTAAGEITFNNGIKIAGGLISNTTTSTRDKIRVWNSDLYTIGMQSNFTHGHLGDYAMTFQMNDDTNRGFWWGHDGHTQSQGAMSLTTDGRLWVDQSLTVAGNEVWHAGNDGAGSGLDADLLDGQEGSYYLPASSYTAADVLAKIKTVDGSGSGLDADTVDGLSSASFIRADTSDNVSGHTEWQDNFSVRLGNGADTRFYHNGTHTYMDNYTGNFYIRDGGTLRFTFERTTGNFTASGNVTAFSDESLKDNIRPYESFDISNLEVKRFERNDLEGKEDVGVIAQEVREYFPEAVIENEDGILSVNYAKLAVAAVAAQKTKMSAMQNEINELRQLINNLKK